MDALNKAGLVQFLNMITDRGWVNLNTGGALKAATNKILADMPPETDVGSIDVDVEIRRYNNLHPGVLSPDSLATYTKRVKAAINHYQQYVADPTKYKPPGRSPTGAPAPAPKKAGKSASTKSDVTDVAVIDLPPPPPPPSQRIESYIATEANLALPFPLRPGYLAQVIIPRDMTKAEAARLCAFISTLAVAE
jgi:hypothetical protein